MPPNYAGRLSKARRTYRVRDTNQVQACRPHFSAGSGGLKTVIYSEESSSPDGTQQRCASRPAANG